MKRSLKKNLLILCLITTSVCFLSLSRPLDAKNQQPFPALWQRVDSLENKGLYRMALTEVNSIFEQATQQKNHNQVIKAVLYELKFNSYLEEDDYVIGINRLEELLPKTPSPSKEILHSLLAEVYWGYYSGNSYQFQSRTNVADLDLKDIRTWDLKRIAVKIRYHYIHSLFNENILQAENISGYSEIITNWYEENEIRPTLFDFLGHRALDFFESNTFQLEGPAETFVLDQPDYFLSNSTFLKLNVSTEDSLNTRFLAVRILHALTDFNKKNLKPSFYLEMERLTFAKNWSTLSNKEELYRQGLERLTQAYKAHDYSSEAWYLIALDKSNQGNEFNSTTDSTHKWSKKEAYDICMNTIANYPNAHGSKQCQALISQILEKDVYLTNEKVIAPNQKNKFLLNYKNITSATVKIVKLNYETAQKYRYKNDKLYREIKNNKGIYTTTLDLSHPADYNQHSSEFLIPELETGYYYIAISTTGNFDEEEGGYTISPFWVSNMTVQTRSLNDRTEAMISDRTTGKPIVGAAVELMYQVYNYAKSEYEAKTIGTFMTNAMGRISIPTSDEYRNYFMTIRYQDETYHPNDNLYTYRNYQEREASIQTHFFTDRKIYRPGQKIFYKGIVIKNSGKDREVMKNHTSTVYLYDTNNQLIKSQQVTTNQFGSFEGTFEAPFDVLTGRMRITNSYGDTDFRVEEYKRPKFNVEMQPVTGEFQLNDSISVTGISEAYAGNKIDGAAVTYRVTRSTEYAWGWGNWWSWRNYASTPKEISNGKLKTNDDGEFDVIFKALPDLESNPKNLPIFTYTIYADVTDINGETHSTSTSIRVGYQSLELGNNIPTEFNNSSAYFLRLSTTNLSGQPISAAGSVSIEKLKMPKQVLYSRLWEEPDMKRWSAEEFKQAFPTQIYANENESYTWSVEKKVFESKFNTAITDSINLGLYKKWEPGIYKYVAVAKDKNGVEVKNEVYFTVFDPSDNKAPNTDQLWVKCLNQSAEPGETVSILLGTLESDLVVNYDTEANGKLIESKTLILNKEQRKLEFKITEAYRGNFTVHFSTVKNSRAYTRSITVTVPYTNKSLDLSFSTFRNKLLPGAEEEWVMTVKNKYGEKEQAELLATLYDASLDALYTPNSYFLNIYQSFYGSRGWSGPTDIGLNYQGNINGKWNSYDYAPYHHFPTLNYFGWYPYYYKHYGYLETVTRGGSGSYSYAVDSPVTSMTEELNSDIMLRDEEESDGKFKSLGLAGNQQLKDVDQYKKESVAETGATKSDKQSNGEDGDLGDVSTRSNFNETAFFYPQLMTDANGDIQIKFTIPESLTKWRFLGLAHTENLKIGTISEEVVTQKDLMVVPNVPRFLREGDQITLSTKISNISDQDLTGQAQLKLYDPFTEKEIGATFALSDTPLNFNVEKGKSTVVSWSIQVPTNQSAVKYKIVAKAGNFSDGEENVLPILSNRMLVTESLPIPIRGKQERTFDFQKLSQSGASKTLKNHSYTLEFTSNPAWYAIQAMPYMMEYPYECAEQTFTRYYSNAIATHIMNSNPKIKQIIEDWGENSPEAFLSNLQKNQELKAVILEETPWVLDAQNEEASKRNLSVLLDMGRMSRELDKALAKIQKTQGANGGWPWFPGMPENRYITQHIVTGMGHLDHLGIKAIRENQKVKSMLDNAVQYLDRELVKDYENAKKWDKDYLTNQLIGYSQIQYLYARSYFPEMGMNNKTKEALEYYQSQAKTYWLKFNIYAEGMIALAANRFEMKTLATDIVKSLKDRSIQHDEFGMYWKEYAGQSYYWYEAPVETQALMIEVFDEIANDQASVEELKIWLLKQKQTTNWKTTKQTTEAVYALLLRGTDLLASDEMVSITVGGKPIEYVKDAAENNPYQVEAQAGTGYFKTVWNKEEVKPEMGKITVSKKSAGVAWGAAYWQYFEDLDKITFAETNLKLKKDLYLVEVSNQGEQLKPITATNPLQVGQKVRVRIELRTDRNLEYVHLKDMRAAGFEPIDVLSQYHYQDGLGYYQATKDAATNFFFDYIPKGTYVFEYDLRVQHTGDFSNGIATIQCMYAPEFTSHSDGIRVKVQ